MATQHELWAEIEAQLAEHGPSSVALYMDDDRYTPLYVSDVVFEDGDIRIVVTP